MAYIQAYAPTDNISEVTARTNDAGWASVFENWLRGSYLTNEDAVFIFSVGGGDVEKNISPNLKYAIDYAKTVGAKVLGIVGRDGGYTAQSADCCIVIPTVDKEFVTAYTQTVQLALVHFLVTHPALKARTGKWESTV
jgi:D-sedoheptulose 7-phosphate isomerase